MKKVYIKDIKHGDILKDELFRVIAYDMQTGKNGSQYIKITLGDKYGTVDGKIWSNAIPYCAECEKGNIVKVSGNIDTFNGALQCVISRLSVVTNEFDMSDFLETASRSSEEIMHEIENYINSMQNLHLKEFLLATFKSPEFRKKFSTYPAATHNHHAYISGLADHVLDMLQMSDNVLQNHVLANKDIVQTGIILHDIGKLEEFEETNFVFTYSLKGKMFGHIFIGANWFNASIPEDFPEDLRMRITHIILSHHGTLEFGSPVTPKTYEALIVHKLDQISATLNATMRAYNSYNGTNDFSERIFPLNNEMLYIKPFIDKESSTVETRQEISLEDLL